MLVCGEKPFGENSTTIVATGQFWKLGKAVLDPDLKYTLILSPVQQRAAQDNHCKERERYCVVAWLTSLVEAVSNSVSILQGQSSQKILMAFQPVKGCCYVYLCYVKKKLEYRIYPIQVLCQIHKMDDTAGRET